MLQVDDKFEIFGYEGIVTCNQDLLIYYWVRWNDTTGICRMFQTSNMSNYTEFYLKKLFPNIKYLTLIAWDSPDFTDLENLNKWVEIIRTLAVSRKIKILK